MRSFMILTTVTLILFMFSSLLILYNNTVDLRLPESAYPAPPDKNPSLEAEEHVSRLRVFIDYAYEVYTGHWNNTTPAVVPVVTQMESDATPTEPASRALMLLGVCAFVVLSALTTTVLWVFREPIMALAREHLRPVLSEYIQSGNNVMDRNFRGVFQRTPIPSVTQPAGKPHPGEAMARARADECVRQLGVLTNRVVYSIQRSPADDRRQVPGSRTAYWEKDFRVRQGIDPVPQRSLNKDTDVQYYLKINQVLLEKEEPYVMYTMVPEHAACGDGHKLWTFNNDNTITVSYSGGSSYTHELHDYARDTVSNFGFIFKSTFPFFEFVYDAREVDRKKVCDSHQLIALSPLLRVTGFRALAAWWILGAHPIKRFRPVAEGWTVFYTNVCENEVNTLNITVGQPGLYAATTVSAEIYACFLMLFTHSSHVHLEAMRTHLISKFPDADWSKIDLAPLYAFIADQKATARLKERITARRNASMVASSFTVHHNPRALDGSEKIRVAQTEYMKPLIAGGSINAALTPSNQEYAKSGRVFGPAGRRPTPAITKFVCDIALEISSYLQKHVGQLTPLELGEVYRRQTKATQRVTIMRGDIAGVVKNKYTALDKAEAKSVQPDNHGEVKVTSDTRIITTHDPSQRPSQASYMLAIADALKKFPWYGPGKTPEQIEERLAQICALASAKGVPVKTPDLEKCDAMAGSVFWFIMTAVMMRLFDPSEHEAIREMLDGSLAAKIYAAEKDYTSGWNILSGHNGTSVFGSMLNLVLYYTGLRSTPDGNGSFLNADQAWEALEAGTIVFGDDSVDVATTEKYLIKAAGKIGASFDFVSESNGRFQFLGRYYDRDLGVGVVNSCSDMYRQLSKLHLTNTRSGVTPEVAAYNKALSYSLTDPQTPVLGVWSMKVLKLTTQHTREDQQSYWARKSLKEASFFTNVRADWMYELLSEQLVSVPVREIKEYEEYILSCTTLQELLNLAPLATFTPKFPDADVIVDDLRLGPNKARVLESPKNNEVKKSEVAKVLDKATKLVKGRLPRQKPKPGERKESKRAKPKRKGKARPARRER